MLKESIVEIQDWPVEGVNFKDLSKVLTKPGDFRWTLDQFKNFMAENNVNCIAAPDARGFIWEHLLLLNLNFPFI